MTDNYEKMTLVQLKAAAKENGIALSASMRKNDIVMLLAENEAGKSQIIQDQPEKEKGTARKSKLADSKDHEASKAVKTKAEKNTTKTSEAVTLKAEMKEIKTSDPVTLKAEMAEPEAVTTVHDAGRTTEPAAASASGKDEVGGSFQKETVKRKTDSKKQNNRAEKEKNPALGKINSTIATGTVNKNTVAEARTKQTETAKSERPDLQNKAVPTKNAAQPVSTSQPESAAPARASQPESATPARASQPENAAPARTSQPESATVLNKRTNEDNGTLDNRQQQQRYRNEGRRPEIEHLDSGEIKEGILEIMPDGYGFIRCDNFLPGENDVYVAPAQIRKLNLKTGDIIVGNTKVKSQTEKFSALLFVKSVNGRHPSEAVHRKRFEDLTPIYPNERIHLEMPGCCVSMRMVDIISPIGKGQRGMIVSQPKAGKTTLLKQIAKAITTNHKEIHLIILLIDERPEEVTDMKESIEGENVEVIYSTFDEEPDNHRRVSEMVIERAKRLVEFKKDVVILLDSITRLSRAYNLTVQSSGRTLSGGLDPAALHMPKRFFGAARNMREGGSLTILATALVETGSRMDDVVFEEFKGTGNMELVLDRNLSERRIFPAIDLPKSSTRREDLLLTQAEIEANYLMRRALNSIKSDDAVERIINMFTQTKNNEEFIEMIKKTRIV